MREVGEQAALLVEHLRADGNAELDRLARRAVAVGTLSVASTPGLETSLSAEVAEVPKIGVGQEDDVAAPTAVAAVRPSPRDVLLPAEAERAVPAAAARHLDAGAVVEHGV
jgi:hypothetical protein